MKKNNDKNRRIKFFDWIRKKTPEPPEKRLEPTKTVVPEASVEKENPSAPPKKDMEPHTDEKKIPRYAAESVKDDGNILESVRNTDQLEYPFRKVKYRQNISFEDEGKIFFYRKYIIKDYVTAEDGHDYVRELSAGCYDGANGRPVSYCSETYTGRGVEKRYDWELGFYPLPGKIECAFEERFPPLSENPEYRYPRSDYDDPMKKVLFTKPKTVALIKKQLKKPTAIKNHGSRISLCCKPAILI